MAVQRSTPTSPEQFETTSAHSVMDAKGLNANKPATRTSRGEASQASNKSVASAKAARSPSQTDLESVDNASWNGQDVIRESESNASTVSASPASSSSRWEPTTFGVSSAVDADKAVWDVPVTNQLEMPVTSSMQMLAQAAVSAVGESAGAAAGTSAGTSAAAIGAASMTTTIVATAAGLGVVALSKSQENTTTTATTPTSPSVTLDSSDATTVTFSVALGSNKAVGDKVQLYYKTSGGSETALGAVATVDSTSMAAGKVTITVNKSALAAGTQDITAKESDSANAAKGTSAALSITYNADNSVSDGYIKGASVYVDMNNNGVIDVGVDTLVGSTDVNGNFSALLTAQQMTHDLLATGGTDVSTGLAFQGMLKAPAGSTVLNPLTTLVQTLAGNGASAAALQAAQNTVIQALNLPTNLDLGKVDLLKVGVGGTSSTAISQADALNVQAKAVMVANLVRTGAAAIEGASGGATTSDAAGKYVYMGLVDSLKTAAQSGQAVNFADSSAVKSMINSAVRSAQSTVNLDTTVIDNSIDLASRAVANVNQVIGIAAGNAAANASSNSPSTTTIAQAMTDLLKQQVVAQQSIASSLVSGDTTALSNLGTVSAVLQAAQSVDASSLKLTKTVSASTTALVTDTVAPTVAKLALTNAATGMKVGDTLVFNVEFSEGVIVSGAPSLSFSIGTGGPSRFAAYSASKSFGRMVSFTYTLQDTDAGAVTMPSVLVMPAGAAITDLAGNALVSTGGAVNLPQASTGAASVTALSFTDTTDRVAPTLAITSDTSGTAKGDVKLTFTFSEKVLGFTPEDVNLSGSAVKGAFTASTDGKTYTLVVMPTPGTEGNFVATVGAQAARDLGGNYSAGSALTQNFDLKPPMVDKMGASTFWLSSASGNTSTLKFVFSDAPGAQLTASDFAVTGGTVSEPQLLTTDSSGKTYTLTFTADSTLKSGNQATISLKAGAFTDVNGNNSVASGKLVLTKLPQLTQSFIQVTAGKTTAYADNGTPGISTDDVLGSYTAKTTDKVGFVYTAKSGGNLPSNTQTLVDNIVNATTVAAFDKAVNDARAVLDLNFGLDLGNATDINGDGTADKGAKALMLYKTPGSADTSISFTPDGAQNVGVAPVVLTQSFVQVATGKTVAYANNGTPLTTADDKQGTYTLTGKESVTVSASPLANSTMPDNANALLQAIKSAATLNALNTAVTQAKAVMQLNYSVNLGDSVDITGDGVADKGSYAALVVPSQLTANATSITLQPDTSSAQAAGVQPILLTQSFLKVAAGLTAASADNGTPTNATDDRTGSYVLTGKEAISVAVKPLTTDGALPSDAANLLSAIGQATSPSAFAAAVTAAKQKLIVNFGVNLGSSTDITGDGLADLGAKAFLNYTEPSSGAADITFSPAARLGQLGQFRASISPGSASSKITNTQPTAESAARSIADDGTRLFIDTDGNWSVGQAPQMVNGKYTRDYKPVTFLDDITGNTSRVNDDTFEASAVSAKTERDASGVITGYEIIVRANDDASMLFSIYVNATGNIVNTDELDDSETLAAEGEFGIDLNESGAVGSEETFLAEGANGAPDLYINANGDLVLHKADGTVVTLKMANASGTLLPIPVSHYSELEFTGVLANTAGSGVTLYVKMPDGALATFTVSADGVVTNASPTVVAAPDSSPTGTTGPTTGGTGIDSTSGPAPIDTPAASSTEATLETIAGGLDLNRDNGTSVTAGWIDALKTTAIKSALNAATATDSAAGPKLTHAEAVSIVKAAIDAATQAGTSKVGADIVSDLRAVASRGDSLFTSTDQTGQESGYLNYVFDKIVNASKANNTYTGGTTKAVTLGNLTAESPIATLQKLSDKWLLGLDMPNPTTEGDTANPNAAATTGSYLAFSGVLSDSLGFNYTDVQQGSMGDCYFLASLAGIAQMETYAKQSKAISVAGYTTALEKMFASNSDGSNSAPTWGVRYYDAKGQAQWVTVNNQFVVKPGDTLPAYAALHTGEDGTKELWVALAEKAYAQANALDIFGRQRAENTFFTIEGGGADPMASVMGGSVTRFVDGTVVTNYGNNALTTPNKTLAEQLAIYKAAINRGEALWVGSDLAATDANGSRTWVAGHALMAFDADPADASNDTVNIYNPWGSTNTAYGFVSPFTVKLSDFITADTKVDFWELTPGASATTSQTLSATQVQQLGQLGGFKAAQSANSASSKEINTPDTAEAYARDIASDGTRLFIDSDGNWNVGIPTTLADGSVARNYKPVTFQGVKINDDTFEATALAARSTKDANGLVVGYEIILEGNDDASVHFRVYLDINGQITNTDELDDNELLAAESPYGLDLNNSGAVGDAQMFLAEGATGAPDLYTDKFGDLILKKSDGTTIALHTDSGTVSYAHFENVEFTGVISKVVGNTTTYILVGKTADDTMAELTIAADGFMTSEALSSVDSGAIGDDASGSLGSMADSGITLSSLANAAGGLDLTRNSSTPATAGWENSLSNATIKAAVQAAIGANSAGGARINYDETLSILKASVDAVTANGGKVGDAIMADLRAIATRGDALFTSKDLTGQETGYLSYVFDKVVNTSKANNFFTGGTTTPVQLGNLNANSTASDLGKLRDKWLLGLDLPNPTTEGDSANPKAKPAVGTYVAFTGSLTDDKGFNYTDVQQGSMGDCYLLADLAGIAQEETAAKANPNNTAIANYQQAFEKVFVTNASTSATTWGVRMYDFNGNAHWVTVNNQFVVKAGETTPAYAKLNGGTELWAALLEKAYAQANELDITGRAKPINGFVNIEGGGADPFTTFMSGVSTLYTADKSGGYFNSVSTMTPNVSYTDQIAIYKAAINRGEVLYVGSSYATTNGGKDEWVSGHAFMAFDADPVDPNNDSIVVYNPWGTDSNAVVPFNTTLSSLIKEGGPKIQFFAMDSIPPKMTAYYQSADDQITVKFSEGIQLPAQVTAKLYDGSNTVVVSDLVLQQSSVTGSPNTMLLTALNKDMGMTSGYVVFSGLFGKDGVKDVMGNPLMQSSPTGFGGFAMGGTGDSTIDLSAVSDKYFVIAGGTGNDVIKGGAGTDVIYGNAGNNTMTGGAGADTFVFLKSDLPTAGGTAPVDAITDFKVLEGDRLDLRDLMPNVSSTTLMNAINNYVSMATAGNDINVTIKGDVAGSANKVDLMTIVLKDANVTHSLTTPNISQIPLTDLINTYNTVKVI